VVKKRKGKNGENKKYNHVRIYENQALINIMPSSQNAKQQNKKQEHKTTIFTHTHTHHTHSH
jgi:hypothetical protein